MKLSDNERVTLSWVIHVTLTSFIINLLQQSIVCPKSTGIPLYILNVLRYTYFTSSKPVKILIRYVFNEVLNVYPYFGKKVGINFNVSQSILVTYHCKVYLTIQIMTEKASTAMLYTLKMLWTSCLTLKVCHFGRSWRTNLTNSTIVFLSPRHLNRGATKHGYTINKCKPLPK